jgi:hypothetical protein
MDLNVKIPIIVLNNLKNSFEDRLSKNSFNSMTLRQYFNRLKGNCLDNYTLKFGKKYLNLDKKLNYYQNLFPIYVCEFKPKSKDQNISCNIRTLEGSKFILHMKSSDLVWKLKEKIEDEEGISPDKQRIIFNGKQLESCKSLNYYKVESNSTLHVVQRLRGGGMIQPKFVDLSKQNTFIDTGFSNKAPKWRIVNKGLNIHGSCLNSSCPAYDEEVICPQEFGVFDLILDSSSTNCPMCRFGVYPETCGFTNCNYIVLGTKIENGNLVPFVQNKWVTVGDFYRYFDSDVAGAVEWKSLKILCHQFGKLKPLDSFCFICLKSSSENSTNLIKLNCGHIKHSECNYQLKGPLQQKCLVCLD